MLSPVLRRGSNWNVHRESPGNLVKWRFWLSLRFCSFNKLPGVAGAADPWTSLWVARGWLWLWWLVVSSLLSGLCLQRWLYILGIWNLLRKLIGQYTQRDIIKLLHFLSLAGPPALRYSSILDGSVPDDFFTYGFKKVLGECQETQGFHHLERNMSSSTLSCLIAGTLYLPDKSVLYGKPAALGSRHSSALEEITGSN